MASFLANRLRDAAAVLEIGTGTGRLSLPLSERGIPIVGTDLSERMMTKLVEKAGGKQPFPLVRADATLLPLRGDSFDAAIACWVLHLIPQWRQAIAEVARVLRAGGLFFVNQGSWGQQGEWWYEVQERFATAAGAALQRPGVIDADELDEAMRGLAASVEVPEPLVGTTRDSPARRIANLEAGMFSWTWKIDSPTRARAADEVRRWARQRYGSIEEERELHYADTWRIYRL